VHAIHTPNEKEYDMCPPCYVSKQNSVEMFIPICAIFVHELGQQQPNNIISIFSLTISLKVVSHRANVSKQKMNGKDFNGFIVNK
jgi:hypothetical protein